MLDAVWQMLSWLHYYELLSMLGIDKRSFYKKKATY